MPARTTRKLLIGLLGLLAVLLGAACERSEDSTPAFRVAETLSFASAVDQHHVVAKNIDLGPITRAGLMPASRRTTAGQSSFESELIEDAQEQIAKEYGFEVLRHRHELYGTCSDCQKP